MPENKFNNEIKQAMESFDIPMVPVDTAYDLFLNKKKKKRGKFQTSEQTKQMQRCV